MTISTRGLLYEKGSPVAIEITATVVAGRLSIEVPARDHSQEWFELETLRFGTQVGKTPRQCFLPDGRTLNLDYDLELDTAIRTAKGEMALGRWENSKRWLVASLVLVPLMLFGLYRFGIPAFAIAFAPMVPDSAVEAASHQTLYALERTLLDESELDKGPREELIAYWQDMVNQIGLNPENYRIRFYASAMGPNAFALPDGTIVITDELVELLEADQDVLFAILLHEIGHVEQHHSMRMVAQSVASALVLGIVFNDLEGIMEVLGGTTTTVVQNRFSQTHEWEADNFAIEQLVKAGKSPELFASAMEKLAALVGQENQLDHLLSTHPLMLERIENARHKAAQSE